ncbi:MAG: sigma-70 family RNA polymerase sigma factor [Duncaniella sp.]|uniref:RNA polymerase sigma factor n=1 Tax=Duncaniella sp. TaxID=2518496 RepID=UPI0023BBF7FF|nr:sigma-70 family RNA polymerase sigma factor [Duncaniella sp.]MDE5989650.1 sigma-70 family RNA polymerase sigma factor [Duncaniella sp.]MDE6175038.1 sigma-70 family RNA polymerase sigma factor [Duncaniella sp.]
MDRSEFERMAPRLRERIVSFVIGMSAEADSDMADDVAQDTLLKLWMMRDKLEQYRSIDSLAFVIARNRTLDLLRGSYGTSTVGMEHVGQMAGGMSPEESLIDSEEAAGVMEIIASLPSVQQAVIRMKHIEGLEVGEIARITGSTPGSIRVALSRARQNIKDIFMQRQL